MKRSGVLCVLIFVFFSAAVEARDVNKPVRIEPRVRTALRHDLSPPLFLVQPSEAARGPADGWEVGAPGPLPGRGGGSGGRASEVSIDRARGGTPQFEVITPPLVGFEGVDNRNSVVPPDTNGDVGPHHYVQWVNLSLAIWDKLGTPLYGPVDGRSLWSGFGGLCETRNNGDPIVLYDPLADRWLLSQLAFVDPNDYHQCIAVSQTPDPTGAWHRYDFLISHTNLNDYPKFGVWPDAYYMAINQFDGATRAYRGQGAIAFERDAMLAGGPARMIAFDLYAVNPNFGGALPSDLDGPLPPPPGAPNIFVEVDDDAWGWGIDRLTLWRFHVEWEDPAKSTFGIEGNPDAVIDLTAAGYPFDADLCGFAACIPQPGGLLLDSISDRLMYRLAYRNFGTHESLVVNHTVDVDGSDHAGIRWYELRGLSATPFVHQAGILAPDASHRWMGSVAMDGAGGIALGYSLSSSTVSPSIRYTGRVASDPPGSLPQGEISLMAGSGYQTGAHRWGDYSMLSVDPVDDCTFWYTQEYYGTIGSYTWQTRVGSFKLDGCGRCPLVGRPFLVVDRDAPGIRLEWTAAANAVSYDVLVGDLAALRAGSGDFTVATTGCLADDYPGTSLHVDEAEPPPGGGFYYLVRGGRGPCRGTLDTDSLRQVGSRDAEVDAAAAGCP